MRGGVSSCGGGWPVVAPDLLPCAFLQERRSKEYMDAYFARIRDMSLHSSLPNRVRFMLQEVRLC